jgi:hypothetical protein
MGAARLLAKGWVVFCLYAGGLALARAIARGAPALDAFGPILVCVLLFGAMGLLFISGYGFSSAQLRLHLPARLAPASLVPPFNETVFVAFVLIIFWLQGFYAAAHHTGPVAAAVEGAIALVVFGQRTLANAFLHCGADGGRLLVSAVAWMLALIFLASALSRIRLTASLLRLERKRRPEALGGQPLAFALGLVAVAGIQLLYVGTGFGLVSCTTLRGLWGGVMLGLGPLMLAYLITAALANLLALGPDA